MPEVVVATYNVHGGVDGWGRPFDVAGACRELDADVLVLQELWSPVGHDVAQELAEELGCERLSFTMAPAWLRTSPAAVGRRWGPRWPRREVRALRTVSGRTGGRPRSSQVRTPGMISVVLFSRLTMRRVETVDIGRMPGDRSRRGVVMAELDVSGHALSVAGTHMSHLSNASPVQFRRLRRALPAPAGTAAVVLGDMNLWGPPLELLLPGWCRAVRARTWPAWRPVAQSDHVLVTPSLAVRHGEAVRVGDSDHLAVRATLAIP